MVTGFDHHHLELLGGDDTTSSKAHLLRVIDFSFIIITTSSRSSVASVLSRGHTLYCIAWTQ
jgi:hypothetical protein